MIPILCVLFSDIFVKNARKFIFLVLTYKTYYAIGFRKKHSENGNAARR